MGYNAFIFWNLGHIVILSKCTATIAIALFPFSWGNIYASSAKAFQLAGISPNYFIYNLNLRAQAGLAKFIHKMYFTKPLDPSLDEIQSGMVIVPKNASNSSRRQ